jgi:sRNA-binding carbon storage regulator CsrA
MDDRAQQDHGGLTFTRKEGQRIVLTVTDPDGATRLVFVTLRDFRGDRCRVTVAAPASVGIDREEVWLLAQQKGGPNAATIRP